MTIYVNGQELGGGGGSALPYTVVEPVEHTTTTASTYHLLTISCSTSPRAYTFRGTVSAAKSDYSNAYSWDVIANVSNNGSVTLRNVLITPTDPASPYALDVHVSGANLRVGVIGVAATSVHWHGYGFLNQYGV